MLTKSDTSEDAEINTTSSTISKKVKTTAEYVSKNSLYVCINNDKLVDFAINKINSSLESIPKWCTCHFDITKYDLETIIAYICAIDSLNFCFWPTTKLGYEFEYQNLVNSLNFLLENKIEFFKPEYLSKVKSNELQEILTREFTNYSKEPFPLIEERCRSLNEMGSFIIDVYQGLFLSLIKNNNCDLDLIMKSILQNVSTFRDETVYKGKQVFMYKRIQILGADLYSAINEVNLTKDMGISLKGIEHLTMFPDYRIPQILNELGILNYTQPLLDDIKALKEIPPNSEYEIEIRAATITVVEIIKQSLKQKFNKDVYSIHLDFLLWNQGENLRKEIVPHHRTLTIFY